MLQANLFTQFSKQACFVVVYDQALNFSLQYSTVPDVSLLNVLTSEIEECVMSPSSDITKLQLATRTPPKVCSSCSYSKMLEVIRLDHKSIETQTDTAMEDMTTAEKYVQEAAEMMRQLNTYAESLG